MNRICINGLLLLTSIVLHAPGQVIQLTTVRNTGIGFAAADLTTSGVPGLTNTAPHLMVAGVSPASGHAGSVSLVTTQAWVRRYSGPVGGTDNPLKVVVDGTQNVIVAGYSPGPGYTEDFVTIKYAADGTALWTNRYDGPAHADDIARCLAVDASGNVYVAGDSKVSGNVVDVATVKYSPDGSLLWASRFNRTGTNDHSPSGLAVDKTGNVYVTAVTFYSDALDFITLKYDPAGNAVWTNYYTAAPADYSFATSVAVDAASNIVVIGDSAGKYIVLQYAPDGTARWTNSYGNGYAAVAAMALDQSGSVMVTGDLLWPNRLYATLKYSGAGVPLWTNLVSAPAYQGGSVPVVAVDLAGNVFLTGGSPSANGEIADFTTLKLSAAGVPLWTNRFFEINSNNAAPGGTAVDNAGNLYFAGPASGPGGTNIDYVTIKYAAAGEAIWTNRYDGVTPNSEEWANGIAVDHAGSVYVTGLSGGTGAGDFATVKYADYVRYTPPAGFIGTDSFTFTAVDPLGNSATGVVAVVVLPENLQFNLDPANFRLGAQGLRLRVDGARGASPVTIYASTNLVNWEPVLTNQPVLGSVQFTDAAATNLPYRFYRAIQSP